MGFGDRRPTGSATSIDEVLAALDRHPHARAVLAPALGPGATPSHAYLFHGPGGSGKRTTARAIAEELLADGSADPSGARARVRSGAHPDLTWVTPSGAHEVLVADVDGPVVAAATRTPFEAARRVFVIERADELGDEAANRMLKTLEEPASFVHLILLTDRLSDVLPTIRSRCQLVRFEAPPIGEVATEIEALGVEPATSSAYARIALGDAERAHALAGAEGTNLRDAAERFARTTLRGEAAREKPWLDLLAAVRSQGEAIRAELERQSASELELTAKRDRKRTETEWTERVRRTRRRVETGTLDLGLQVVSVWFRDLAALEWGADEVLCNVDRPEELAADRPLCDAATFRRAIELVEDTRMRFQLNVAEELACEALAYRLQDVLCQ
jgi:DNA polymerase-3 subunit delta'